MFFLDIFTGKVEEIFKGSQNSFSSPSRPVTFTSIENSNYGR